MAERNPKRTKLEILSHDIPDDIVFSILSKSSVKTLLRFTSVSKSWNNLIRSSAFVAAHLHVQVQEKYDINDCRTFHMPEDDAKPWMFLNFFHEKCGDSLDLVRNFVLYNLVLPFRQYDVAGTCEGLICLTKGSDVYLWNPHIGSMKTLPPSKSSKRSSSRKRMKAVFGIGFDETTCDYKVVKLNFSRGRFMNMEIYSLATDSWKSIDEKNWARDQRWSKFYQEIYYKGSIYWVGHRITNDRRTEYVDLRFNLEEEIFDEKGNLCPMYSEKGNVRAIAEHEYNRGPYSIKFHKIWVRESLVLLDKKHNCTRIEMTSAQHPTKFN